MYFMLCFDYILLEINRKLLKENVNYADISLREHIS